MSRRSPPTEPNGYYDIDKWFPTEGDVDVLLADGTVVENCSISLIDDGRGYESWLPFTAEGSDTQASVKFWKPRGWLAYHHIAPAN